MLFINGREVKFKRPTLRVERDARVLVLEFVSAGEKEANEATEENFRAVADVWKRFVSCVCENAEGLEYEQLTRGEVEELSSGFFALAQARPNSGSGQGT